MDSTRIAAVLTRLRSTLTIHRRSVSFAADVTALVEEGRMKQMTGMKSKEILIWVTLSDMYIDDPESKRITFKTPAGIGRSFPVSAFEAVEEEEAAETAAKEGEGEAKLDGDGK